jgi:hypothetical protein
MQPVPRTSVSVQGIECVLGGERFVLDSTLVERVIEYTVSSLPLARTPIVGLATMGTSVILSVRFFGDAQPGKREGVKGVLLVPRGKGRVRWAIEVDEVRSFVRVNVDHTRQIPSRPWLVATGDETQRLTWLDVERMMRELGDGERA